MNGITRKTATRVGVTGLGALALAGALASTSSAAGTTYTVAVGSVSSGNAALSATTTGTVTFDDTSSMINATCSGSPAATASLTAKLSKTAKAAGLSIITKSTYNNCSALSGQLELTIKQAGKWSFNATGPTASGVTPGVLTKIKANVTSTTTNCKFSAAGAVDASYNNSTGVIAFAPKSGTTNSIKLSKVTGNCLGAANNGDVVDFTGNFKVTATSPTGAFTITSN